MIRCNQFSHRPTRWCFINFGPSLQIFSLPSHNIVAGQCGSTCRSTYLLNSHVAPLGNWGLRPSLTCFSLNYGGGPSSGEAPRRPPWHLVHWVPFLRYPCPLHTLTTWSPGPTSSLTWPTYSQGTLYNNKLLPTNHTPSPSRTPMHFCNK